MGFIEECRKISDAWKPDVIDQVCWIARLAKRPRYHLIGDEADEVQEELPASTREAKRTKSRAD